MANLGGTDFNKAKLLETIFSNVNLGNCKNLDSAYHAGPSIVDVRTLEKSG